jgi:hypothetical protein
MIFKKRGPERISRFFLRGLVMSKEEIKRIAFSSDQSVALYKRCVHIINTRILYEASSHSLMIPLGIYVVRVTVTATNMTVFAGETSHAK